MAQWGKLYPDAFVVQPNTMYKVGLIVSGAAFVAGVQIIYQ